MSKVIGGSNGLELSYPIPTKLQKQSRNKPSAIKTTRTLYPGVS